MVRLNDTNAYSADSSMLWSNDDRSNSPWRLLHPMHTYYFTFWTKKIHHSCIFFPRTDTHPPSVNLSSLLTKWEQKVLAQKTSPSTFNADNVELAGVNLVTNSYREGKTLSVLFLSQRRPKLMKSLLAEKIPKNSYCVIILKKTTALFFTLFFLLMISLCWWHHRWPCYWRGPVCNPVWTKQFVSVLAALYLPS